jgi:hypothetical protein
VSIEPLRIEIDREDDGRVLASVPDLPGMVESGDELPAPLKALFAA